MTLSWLFVMGLDLTILEEWLKERLPERDPSHDLDHYRTSLNLAREIGKSIANLDWDVISAAIYLHDHFHSKKYETEELEILLARAGLNQNQIQQACHILEDRSLHINRYMKDPKGWRKAAGRATPEQRVVNDALHLELVGALGIGRLYAFSGVIGRRFIFPPNEKQEGREDTIDRFNHRLLIQKVMLTPLGKELATGRVRFTKTFLDRFLKEWEGKA